MKATRRHTAIAVLLVALLLAAPAAAQEISITDKIWFQLAGIRDAS